jgi:acyl-CoA thioesterase
LIMEDDLHVHAAALAVHDDVLCLPQSQQTRNTSILASLSDNPTAYNKRIRRGRGPAYLHVHAAALAVHDDVLCLATIEARWDFAVLALTLPPHLPSSSLNPSRLATLPS